MYPLYICRLLLSFPIRAVLDPMTRPSLIRPDHAFPNKKRTDHALPGSHPESRLPGRNTEPNDATFPSYTNNGHKKNSGYMKKRDGGGLWGENKNNINQSTKEALLRRRCLALRQIQPETTVIILLRRLAHAHLKHMTDLATTLIGRAAPIVRATAIAGVEQKLAERGRGLVVA